MREVARQHGMVLVVPFFEEAQTGVYYNSAVVIETDGSVCRRPVTLSPASGQ
jgi:N-carbamoylputrescine amidase